MQPAQGQRCRIPTAEVGEEAVVVAEAAAAEGEVEVVAVVVVTWPARAESTTRSRRDGERKRVRARGRTITGGIKGLRRWLAVVSRLQAEAETARMPALF